MIRKKINDLIARILFPGILLLVAVLAGCNKDEMDPIIRFEGMQWQVLEKSEGIEIEYLNLGNYDRVISKVYLTPPGGVLVLKEDPGESMSIVVPYELRDLYEPDNEGEAITQYSGEYFDFTIERGTTLCCVFHDIPEGYSGQVCEVDLQDFHIRARDFLIFEVQ